MVSWTFLVLVTATVLKRTVFIGCVVGNPLVVICLEFFHGWPGATGLRRTTGVKYPSYHTISAAHAISLTFHCHVDLNHLVEVASVRCLHYKVTHSPLSMLDSSEGSHHMWPTTPPQEQSSYTNYLGFFCLGNLCLHPPG